MRRPISTPAVHIDGASLPPGWGFRSAMMEVRMLEASLAAIPCPIEAKMTWVRELRSQDCSWGEIERITGVTRQAYTQWARRRSAWASEDA